MPELPEVRAHAERLERVFEGSVLERFEPLTFTALKTASPDPSTAVGTQLLMVDTRGKFLLLGFGGHGADGPSVTFLVHLMQGGRLVPDTKLSRRPRNGIARWRFGAERAGSNADPDDAPTPALLLTEAGKEHKAGIWVFEGRPAGADSRADGGHPDDQHPTGDAASSPLADLGPDADRVDSEQLAAALGAKNQRLHGFLRDQRGIAGIGRMLANEICHRARLSPFAMTRKLDAAQRAALLDAVRSSIADALEFERSRDSMSRSADRPARVHRRKGQACPECSDTIRAVEYAAYEVDYCPTCQTGGKVLADNTTSRFLK